MPPGLRQSEKLVTPVFSPATKAESGHDENISFKQMKKELGDELATKLKDASLELYRFAADLAWRRGLILADTKFEFGTINDELILIDEAVTPDSSRLWEASTYVVGTSPDSYDKQFVRDWLTHSGWDKESEPPALPDDVVAQTRERYLTAYQRLVGKPHRQIHRGAPRCWGGARSGETVGVDLPAAAGEPRHRGLSFRDRAWGTIQTMKFGSWCSREHGRTGIVVGWSTRCLAPTFST